MRVWLCLFVTHLVLLLLASTQFTAITVFKDSHVTWDYFQYTYQTGWGVPYQFPYSWAVVLTYLAAYGAGLASYALAWRLGFRIIAAAGVLLCAVGFLSFAYELTHWLEESYDAWIVSCPAALLLLAAAAAIQAFRRTRERAATAIE